MWTISTCSFVEHTGADHPGAVDGQVEGSANRLVVDAANDGETDRDRHSREMEQSSPGKFHWHPPP